MQKNLCLLYLLYIIFNSNVIICKAHNKQQNINVNRKYVPPADLIRPTDVSRELFCDVCQAVFTEALKNLRNLNKESDVAFYLNNNNICAQDNFNGYHFSTPEMEIGCEVFFGAYYDEIEQILIERNPHEDTNKTLIRKFCYKKIKACNGVNLSRIKPIKAEIINGELYDIETVEKVYKVVPKIIEMNPEDHGANSKNNTHTNSSEL